MPHSPKSRPKPKPNSWPLEFEAIGTRWYIQLFEEVDSALRARLADAINLRIEQFDTGYSRFREDSLVTKMSQSAGEYLLPDDAQPLFDIYRELYDITGGCMTPLIGQALSDAGYDAMYSLMPGKVTAPPAWDEVLTYNYPQLTLKQPVLIDVGAAGKGYLVDLVAAVIEDAGVQSYCVDAGGDLTYHARNSQPMAVGLEHPDDPTLVIGVGQIVNGSICGSAGNRRAWGKYNHILDPKQLTSPTHIKAVWVAADSTLLADALTTALYFVPAARLKQRYTFEYVIVRSDNSFEASDNFPGEMFS